MSGLFKGNKKPTEDDVRNFVETRLPNFLYAGGYCGSDSFVVLECRKCGNKTTKSMRAIRKANCFTNKCPSCEETKKRLQEQAEREAKEAAREAKQKRDREPVACKCCGSLFVPSRRWAYCSAECARRVANNHKDNRLKGQLDKDWDITVPALVVRDNNICYLCGGLCDSDDYGITAEGYFIAGPHYPSIDHVKPISKGGKHRWDNVRLAHICCNNKKRNKLL